MTIEYVGGQVSGRAGSTSTTTDSLTDLAGGIGTAPIEGDLVIVGAMVGSQGRNPTCALSSWATIGTQLNVTSTTYDTSFQVSYKWMTSTPDTSITLPSTGNIADAQSWVIQVWRGVDPTTPLDVAAVSATGTATTLVNPASITPTTSGAYVLAMGGGCASAAATYTSSDLTDFLTNRTNDTNDSSIGGGYIGPWSSGAVDPAVWAGGNVNAGNSWAGWTIALRPTAGAVYDDDLSESAAASETVVNTAVFAEAVTDTAAATDDAALPPVVYYVIYASAGSAPSAAQVKARQDATGSAAVAHGNEVARTTTGEQVFAAAASGLTAGTSYRVAFVWSDGTDDSNVSVSDPWSTTAAAIDESASDAAAATETITAALVALDAVSDAAAGSETVAGALVVSEAASDSASATEAVAAALVAADAVTDAAAGTDAVTDGLSLSDAVADSAAGTDSATAVLAFADAVSDAAAATDSATASAVLLDAVADSAAGSETVAGTLTVGQDVTDSAAATDAAVAGLVAVDAVADSADASDAAAGDTSKDEAVSDSAAATDTATAAAVLADAVSDAADGSETVVSVATFLEAVSDSAAASESVTDNLGSVTYNESAEDSAAASETVASTAVLFDAVSDTAEATETVASLATLGESVTDAAAATDATTDSLAGTAPVAEVRKRGGPTRPYRYAMRIGEEMFYADSVQALEAALDEFERESEQRAKRRAQTATGTPKQVARKARRVRVVESPEPERETVKQLVSQSNKRVRDLYESEARFAMISRYMELEMVARQMDDDAAIVALSI